MGLTIISAKFQIFDEQLNLLAENVFSTPWLVSPEERFDTSRRLIQADFRKVAWNIKWNIVFAMEYEVPSCSCSRDPQEQPPRSRLNEDYSQLFESGDHADLTFVVQGEDIRAHKLILTVRSKYFQLMFKTKMEESSSNKIHVTDVAPKVFEELLKFLYSGVPPKYVEKETLQLLAVADKYGVDELKKSCESLICFYLTQENVIDALLLADNHNCPDLMLHATTVFKMRSGDLKDRPASEVAKLKRSPDLLWKLLVSYGEK